MKRFLALLLCAVMLFSVLGLEVWAADGDVLTVYARNGSRRQVNVGDTVTYTYSLRLQGVYELDRIRLDVLFDSECLELLEAEYPSFQDGTATDTPKNEANRTGDFHVEKSFIPNGSSFSQSICDIVRVTFRVKRGGTTFVRTMPERIEVESSKESDIYIIDNYRANALREKLIATYDYLGDNQPTAASTKLNTAQDTFWYYVTDRDTGERVAEGQSFALRGTDESGKYQEFESSTDEYGLIVFRNVPFGNYTLTCTSELPDGRAYCVVEPNVTVPAVTNGQLNVQTVLEVRAMALDEMRDIRVDIQWTDEYIEPGVKYTAERPENIYLEVTAGGKTYARTYLPTNRTRIVLERLPIADENGNELTYTLFTDPVEHYKDTITPTDTGFSLTFRYLNDHNWDKERTEPTCDESGRILYTCLDCGKVYTFTLSPLGHDYAISGYDATCERDGYHLYVCRRCQKWYAETTPKLGHQWGEWVTDVEATENTDGQRHRVCERCGTREEGVIACMTHEHRYTTNVVQPTCTEGGYTEKVCLCGDRFVVEGSRTPATGHDFTGNSATREVIPNSCTKDGLVEYTCSKCGAMHAEVLKAHGHNFEIIETRDADCTHSGYTISECAWCHEKRTTRTAALGHDYGEWIIDVPATSSTPGSQHRLCRRCGYEEVAQIPVISAQHVHHYDKSETVAPTCTEQGYTKYICPDDGASFIDTDSYIPALGHDWKEDWRTESTARTRGVICFKCENCGEMRFESLPKKDGEWNNTYWDVHNTDWFFPYVRYVSYNDYMNGTSSARFEPNGPMTRAMLVTVLYRMVGEPAVTNLTMPFVDVPSGSGVWYHDAVLWAYDTGVVDGVSETEFDPNRLITREQMVTIFWRYANYAGYDTSEMASLWGYADASRVSSYAKDAFSWAVSAGIINGVEVDGAAMLDPKGNATRAQAAAIIQRFDAWRLK